MTGMPAKVNGHAAIQPSNACAPDGPLTVEVRRDLDLSQEEAAALNALIEGHPEVGVFLSRASAEFDFLKGAEPVKYLWPVRERATFDAAVYSARCGAQLERAARATRDAAAAFAKSARSLSSE